MGSVWTMRTKKFAVNTVLTHRILNRGSLKNLTWNSKTVFTLSNISRQELRIHSSSLTFATRLAKGQLISECLFGIFNSPKKRIKKFIFTIMVPKVKLFSFVFGENWRHRKDISKLTELYLFNSGIRKLLTFPVEFEMIALANLFIHK